MANVNITQIKSLLGQVSGKTVVQIHADVLLQILNAYKTNCGNDATPTIASGNASGGARPPGVLDLTGF